MRKKILVVGPLPPPYAGGVASFVACQISSTVLKNEFEISCLNTTVAGRLHRWLPLRILTSLRFFLGLFACLFRYRPDLVHIHSTSYSSFFEKSFMLFACRLIGTHAVIHIHGGYFEKFYRDTIFKFFVRFALNRADRVVVVSPCWRHFFEQVCRKQICVIPNCAAEMFFIGNQKPTGGSDILFVGRFAPEKGILELLESIKLLREESIGNRVVIVGGSDNHEELTQVKESISAKRIEKVQLVLDAVPEKVLELLKKAAIFVLPSHQEGLPIALLEAMAAGLPVVVSPVGGIADVVTDCENGFLVPAGESRLFADRIKQLLEDQNLRRRMGARNYESALESHHPERSGERLAVLYRSILENQ